MRALLQNRNTLPPSAREIQPTIRVLVLPSRHIFQNTVAAGTQPHRPWIWAHTKTSSRKITCGECDTERE